MSKRNDIVITSKILKIFYLWLLSTATENYHWSQPFILGNFNEPTQNFRNFLVTQKASTCKRKSLANEFSFVCMCRVSSKFSTICLNKRFIITILGHAVAQLVQALRYKPGGHGFDYK